MGNSENSTKNRSPVWTWAKRLLIFILIVGLPPVLAMLFYGLLSEPEQSDVIVVPGAALTQGGNGLSNALEWRMQTAVELYHKGYGRYLLLSGGGEGAWREAPTMANWAVERGVPRERIIIDNQGNTTRETAINVARIMRERNLSTALAVSQWYHVPRLRLALMQEGVEQSGSTCAHPRFLDLEFYFSLREVAGLYAYLFRLDEHRDNT